VRFLHTNNWHELFNITEESLLNINQFAVGHQRRTNTKHVSVHQITFQKNELFVQKLRSFPFIIQISEKLF